MADDPESDALEAPHHENIARVSVAELDSVLGHPYKVLDDGFVRIID